MADHDPFFLFLSFNCKVLYLNMSETSTKPYLLRAIYEWCTDNGYTPHIAAAVDGATRVPMEFVKNGEIVLNISFSATSGLKMDNDVIRFSARFGGVSRDLLIPVDNVIAIYARENGQGMAFEASNNHEALSAMEQPDADAASVTAPTLTAVPSGQNTQEGDGNEDIDVPPEPPKKGGRPTLTRIK
jgi:stringent starvation protein B